MRDTPEGAQLCAARVIVYGRNPVSEALRGGGEAQSRIWATERPRQEPWLAGVRSSVFGATRSRRSAGRAEHQGICAEAGAYPYAAPEGLLAGDDALVVCLDEVQDPHNLGAVCRVAEAAGAAGVVIPERRSAEVTPAVCKASAGAVEHLSRRPGAQPRRLARRAKDVRHVGLRGRGRCRSVPYDQPDYSGRVVIVLGSEGNGLRPRVAGACDQLIAIPQRGRSVPQRLQRCRGHLVRNLAFPRQRG